MMLFPSVLKEEYSSVILNWRSIMKSSNDIYVTVKEAANELEVRKGQIKELINHKLIDYKFENGHYVVNINSLDKSSLKLLKHNDISTLIRSKHNEKIFESTKKLDESLIKVMLSDVLGKHKSYDNPSKKEVVDCVVTDWKNDAEFKNNDKELFSQFCSANSINYKDHNTQYHIHKTLSEYHNEDKFSFGNSEASKYGMLILNDKKCKNNGFYFIEMDSYQNIINELRNSMQFIQTTDMLNGAEKSYDYYCQISSDPYVECITKNSILYLSIDDFIKEFSPSQYYQKNTIWSMYLETIKEETKNAVNDEEINHHTNKFHTVNGYWKRQPFGSRENPQYRRVFVESFERGGKITKKAA